MLPIYPRALEARDNEPNCSSLTSTSPILTPQSPSQITHRLSFPESAKNARRFRFAFRRGALLALLFFLYTCFLSLESLLLSSVGWRVPFMPLQSFLFVRATAFQATLSYSNTPFTSRMCPTTFPPLTSSARSTYGNTCPFYDLYYIMLTGTSGVSSLVAPNVVPADAGVVAQGAWWNMQQQQQAEEASKSSGVSRKGQNSKNKTSSRATSSQDSSSSVKGRLSPVSHAKTSTSTAAAAATQASDSFNSIFKGPRKRISSYYEVLTTDAFFYMLSGCTIVIEIGSSLAPSYAYNNFQSYVKNFVLTAPVATSSSGSDIISTSAPATSTTTTTTTTPTTTAAPSSSNEASDSAQTSTADADTTFVKSVTPAKAAAATATTAAVYPGISLKSSFFYWNQPRLHCLFNAPVFMAMRSLTARTSSLTQLQPTPLAADSLNSTAGKSTISTQLPPSALAASTTKQGVKRSRRGERKKKTEKEVGVCPDEAQQEMNLGVLFQAAVKAAGSNGSTGARVRSAKTGTTTTSTTTATATTAASAASSFASCPAYLPDPGELIPDVDTDTVLTANYLQLSSNIVLKVFSFDVWYQLTNPFKPVSRPWLSDRFNLLRYSSSSSIKAERQRSYTKDFSSIPPAWSKTATTAAAATSASATVTTEAGTTTSTLEELLDIRADSYRRLGDNLYVDPERVCTAPALYTVSLNALLADAASWSLGTSGDWMQTNITITHNYPSARGVAVVAQCSGVPLSFSVTATFTNPSNRPGSGQNYYTSIIYFLFLVLYALLFIVFLILIVPCGKRRERERELKQKDAERAQEKQAAEMKSDRVHRQRHNARRQHRHRRRSRSGENNNNNNKSYSGDDDDEDVASTRGSSSSSSRSTTISRDSSGGSKNSPPQQQKRKKIINSERDEITLKKAVSMARKGQDAAEEPIHGEAVVGRRGASTDKAKADASNKVKKTVLGMSTAARLKKASPRSRGRSGSDEEAEMSSLHSMHSNASYTSSDAASTDGDASRERESAADSRSGSRATTTTTKKNSKKKNGDKETKKVSKEKSKAASASTQKAKEKNAKKKKGTSGRRRRDSDSNDGSAFSSRSGSTKRSDVDGGGRRRRRRSHHHRRGDGSTEDDYSDDDFNSSDSSDASRSSDSESDASSSTHSSSSEDNDTQSENFRRRRGIDRRRSGHQNEVDGEQGHRHHQSSAHLHPARSHQPSDLFSLLCCCVARTNDHSSSNDDVDEDDDDAEAAAARRRRRRLAREAGLHNLEDSYTRHRPPFISRCTFAMTELALVVQVGVQNKILRPLEQWWKESYVIIMYSPLQWLLLVLIPLKVLVCTLYSAKYSLMAETTTGTIQSSFSLYVVCVIFSIATDSLIISLEMLISMGWGLAFTAPLPTNQIVIVCIATIGVFIEYAFEATCDMDGYNLGLTVNPYAKAANGGRCNSVTYARVGVEMTCRLHNVLRMFLLSLWLSRSVVPADAAAVQRQRRLRERQLRRSRHQQRRDSNNGGGNVNKGSKGTAEESKKSGGSNSRSRSRSRSSSSTAASSGLQRGNGLVSNPPPLPPPPINLSPPPRLGYPGVTLSAMDVYLRYQSMWAPFGMLLVWYMLSFLFAFTFFQPEDYYMVVAFREFQTFYLFAFIVLFLRTSSPEYT